MKLPATLRTLELLSASALLFIGPSLMLAQDTTDLAVGESAYGYSSIDYDPNSNQITAYAETGSDSELAQYYYPEISVSIQDDQGNQYSSSCSYGGDYSSYASASCQFAAGASSQYTINAAHWFLLSQYYSNDCGGEPDCGNPQYWIDYYNFQYTSSLGIDDPFEAYFYGPGPEADTMSPDIILGGSNDYATVSTPPPCGDVRDQMISEYTYGWWLPNGMPWLTSFGRVSCSDFIMQWQWVLEVGVAAPYNWYSLIPDQDTGYPNFAILQPYLETGLEQLSSNMGQTFTINSGYRNPHAEIQATLKNCNGGPTSPYCMPASGSRHMAGDGVDIATGFSPYFWSQIQAEAHANWAVNPPACVEPYRQSGYGHIHVDWRTQGAGHFYYPPTCPTGW